MCTGLHAQDLDPRAYARIPVNLSALITGFAYSEGDVVSDPTLPVKNIHASVQTATMGYAHSLGLLGLTSQVLVALPYAFAQVSGEVDSQLREITRSGLADMRLRYSVLLIGAPATKATGMPVQRKSVVGVSLNVIAPTGQFFSDKLINIGTHRFSFRPEIALSQPIGKKWLMDVYAGVWLFTENKSFFPGSSVRTQAPMGTLQAHLSYNITRLMWVAMDATFYSGGTSSVNGKINDDRQENSRIGGTAYIPLTKKHGLKLAYSRGVIVRVGQNFSTASIGWQYNWLRKRDSQ